MTNADRIWSPYEIKLLLHMSTTPEPWPLAHTDHYRAVMRKMHSDGLVDNPDFPAVTERGAALIDLWCQQPIPVAVWVDPRLEPPA